MEYGNDIWINIAWTRNEIKEYAREQFQKELSEGELDYMMSSIHGKLEEELTTIGNKALWDMLDEDLKLKMAI